MQLRPAPPFQEAVPGCAIILGTLILLREAERGCKRRERKQREEGEEKGKKRQGKAVRGTGEDSASA